MIKGKIRMITKTIIIFSEHFTWSILWRWNYFFHDLEGALFWFHRQSASSCSHVSFFKIKIFQRKWKQIESKVSIINIFSWSLFFQGSLTLKKDWKEIFLEALKILWKKCQLWQKRNSMHDIIYAIHHFIKCL